MNCAIYTRVSLDRENESESPERQEAECRRLVESKGWTVAEVFCDRDLSAFSGKKRPALERLWKELDAGRVGAVVVWKMDRLTRRFEDTGPIMRRVRQARAELVSVTENLDTSTPIGQAIVGFVVAQAEQSSRDTALRVSSKWKADAAQGKPHVGRRCFGYTTNFEQIPDEVRIARELVTRILGGESLRAVATELNQRNIKTAAGRNWSHATLRQWLRAPALAGLRVYRPLVEDPRTGKKQRAKTGTEVRGTWDPIISTDEREQLLIHLGSTPPSGRKNEYLLRGLILCGRCGYRMYGHGVSYACQTQPENDACGKVTVVRGAVEAHVQETVLSALATIEAQPVDASIDPSVLQRQVDADETALGELNRQRFVSTNGVRMTQAEWEPLHDALAKRIADGKAALASLEQSSHGLRPGKRQDLDAWWESATIDQQRIALSQVLSKIVVQPATVKGARFNPARVHCYPSPRYYGLAASWGEERWDSMSQLERRIAERDNEAAVSLGQALWGD